MRSRLLLYVGDSRKYAAGRTPMGLHIGTPVRWHDESSERLRPIQAPDFCRWPVAYKRFGFTERGEPTRFGGDEIEWCNEVQPGELLRPIPSPSLEQVEQ